MKTAERHWRKPACKNNRNSCPEKESLIGFTLIELLIVIAIIGILASMLLPALSKARETTKTLACVNRMKQLGVAFMAYLPDWDDTFPYDFLPQSVTGNYENCFWQQRMLPYAGDNHKLFTCINYDKPPVDGNDKNYYYWFCSDYGATYGYNHRVLGCGGQDPGWWCSTLITTRAASIKSPSTLNLLVDCAASRIRLPHNDVVNYRKSYFHYPTSDRIVYRTGHRSKKDPTINILYTDGHVKGVSLLKAPTFQLNSTVGWKNE